VLPFLHAGPELIPLLRQIIAHGSQITYAQKILSSMHAYLRQTETGPIQEPISGTIVEPLTDRERQILRLLATGLSSTEIAAELVIAVSTTRSYLKTVYRKLDVHSRDEAIARARALGWL
jgi:LuxR family transcriptional regulator, maltose regulon positive regulatory protein